MEYTALTGVIHQPGDDVHVPFSTSIYPSSPKSKEMWDTHGYIQNWMNPCVREEWEGPCQPFPTLYDIDGPVVEFTSPYTPRDLVRRQYPFLDADALDELALRSENAITQIVTADVSLVNFLLELIETIEGSLRGINRFKTIYERIMKNYQAALKRFLKQGIKHARAAWLAWNFAIKPFIKDLQAILCGMSSAWKKMKWLQDHNHKVVYRDYSRTNLEDLVSFDKNELIPDELFATIFKGDDFAVFHSNGTHHIAVRFIDLKIDYHARGKIFLDIPEGYLEGAHGLNILWSVMQGITNPIGIVWEAIPFSWLIDYFLSYRSRIWQTAYGFNPYNAGVTLLGTGHSFTIEVSGDVSHYRYFGGEWHEEPGFDGAWKYKLYWRQSGLPYPDQPDYLRLPSDWYHLSIIGAVGGDFYPPRKK
jgi:hypothetical protein